MYKKVKFGMVTLEIRNNSVVTSDNEIYELPSSQLDYHIIIHDFQPFVIGSHCFVFDANRFAQIGFVPPIYSQVTSIGAVLYFFNQRKIFVYKQFKCEKEINFGNVIYIQDNICISEDCNLIDLVSFDKYKGQIELKQLQFYLKQSQEMIKQTLSAGFHNFSIEKVNSNFQLAIEIAQDEYQLQMTQVSALSQYKQMLYNLYELENFQKEIEIKKDGEIYSLFASRLQVVKDGFEKDIQQLEQFNQQELDILEYAQQQQNKVQRSKK